MKRLFSGLFALLLLALGARPAWGAQAEAPPPALHAEAAVLIDAGTGQVLAEKNSRRRMQPASLTKIMTCLLGMEAGTPDARVTVTAEALRLMPGSSAIGLLEGERPTMAQLLYAAMLPSANDAAAAVGIHLAGSSPAFAERMNRRAAELGLTGTHFSNAHGLPARDHYTTAYDLAQITWAALEYPEFLDYAGARSYYIPPSQWNRGYSFSHLNRALLPGSSYYDPRAIAGKTGWTVPAGNCLMTVAEQDGVRLIAVVLKADDATATAYQDTRALFDYGFTAYRAERFDLPPARRLLTLPAAGGEQEFFLSAKGGSLDVLLPLGLDKEGLTLELAGLEEGASGENGCFWGRLVLRDGSGAVRLEAGRMPLQGQPLAAQALGPSPVVYLPDARTGRQPEWWMITAAGAGCLAVFAAAKFLYSRKSAGQP